MIDGKRIFEIGGPSGKKYANIYDTVPPQKITEESSPPNGSN
jgi:hypothetical protein